MSGLGSPPEAIPHGRSRTVSSRGKRKRRMEQAEQAAARRSTQKGVKLVTLAIVAAIVLLGVAAAVFRGEGRSSPVAGSVWSAEHGHWH